MEKYLKPSFTEILSLQKWQAHLPFFLHFFFAVVFFSYFLFDGQIYVGSTDLLEMNYPALLQAKREFLNFNLGLWNPHLISGSPSALSAFAPKYSPENWLLFNLPETFFFKAVTLLMFFKMIGLGFLSYCVFIREISHAKYALICSLVFQLSGYTAWALSSDAISPVFYCTLLLYVTWSFKERPQWKSLLFTTLTSVLILTSGHLLFCFYSLFFTSLFCIYRIIKIRDYLLCNILALAITAVRWLPSVIELSNSNRIALPIEKGFEPISFLFFKLFHSELFGVSYYNSSKIISSLSYLFKSGDIQVYTHFPHFFGVLSSLIVFSSLVGESRKKIPLFIRSFFLISLSIILGIEPLTTVFKFLSHPFYHLISIQFALMIGFCFCLLHSLKAIEDHALPLLPLKCLVAIVSLYFTAHTLLIMQFNWNASLLVKIVSLVSLLFYFRSRLLLKICLIAFGFLASIIGSFIFIKNQNFISWQILQSSLELFLISVFYIKLLFYKNNKIDYFFLFLILMYLIFLIYPFQRPYTTETEMNDFLLLLSNGYLRFFILTLCLFQLVKPQYTVQFPFILIILISIELLSSFKINADVSINPFFNSSTPYPTRQISPSINSVQYRINNPNKFLNLPIFTSIYADREPLSSHFSLYDQRSFGGYVNAMPKDYETFLSALIPKEDLYSNYAVANGFQTGIQNSRALDLLGVGYDYHIDTKVVSERKTALARFMIFSNVTIAEDKLTVPILKDIAFNPLQKIILNEAPLYPITPSNTAAKIIDPIILVSDKILFNFETRANSLFYFGDTFHKGWKAYRNGTQEKITKANSAFMAVALPAGTHQLELVFEPIAFQWAMTLSIAGIIILFLLLFSYYISLKVLIKKRNKLTL